MPFLKKNRKRQRGSDKNLLTLKLKWKLRCETQNRHDEFWIKFFSCRYFARAPWSKMGSLITLALAKDTTKLSLVCLQQRSPSLATYGDSWLFLVISAAFGLFWHQNSGEWQWLGTGAIESSSEKIFRKFEKKMKKRIVKKGQKMRGAFPPKSQFQRWCAKTSLCLSLSMGRIFNNVRKAFGLDPHRSTISAWSCDHKCLMRSTINAW